MPAIVPQLLVILGNYLARFLHGKKYRFSVPVGGWERPQMAGEKKALYGYGN